MVFILTLVCLFQRIVGTSELPTGEVPSIGKTPGAVRQYYEKRYVHAKNQKLDPCKNLQLMLSTETDNCFVRSVTTDPDSPSVVLFWNSQINFIA